MLLVIESGWLYGLPEEKISCLLRYFKSTSCCIVHEDLRSTDFFFTFLTFMMILKNLSNVLGKKIFYVADFTFAQKQRFLCLINSCGLHRPFYVYDTIHSLTKVVSSCLCSPGFDHISKIYNPSAEAEKLYQTWPMGLHSRNERAHVSFSKR